MENKNEIQVTARSAAQLGQALFRLRKLQGWTQIKLSQMANLRQGTVSKIEKGIETTSLKVLFDICSALDLEITIKKRKKNGK